jgi:predicted membrane-bound spermidine synthase
MSRTTTDAPPSSLAAGVASSGAAPRWLYFAIFTISGFSGLLYESIWSHYLKLFLGHAAYAQSLVLIIFMGGLAVGSWLAAKFSGRWRFPIVLYAVVEGVIGVIALVFHSVFVSVSDTFYFSLLPSIDSVALGATLKWSAAALLIVPQSVLLGMTFPLMSTGILRRFPDHPGGSLAMLYFTNSLGAAIGVLASGFWLIGLFGLPGTILTAGLLNIALALVVWGLVKLDPHREAGPLQPSRAVEGAATDGIATLFFFAAGVTGAASFIYEIGWIRMLSLVLGSTTHSFELMLSAFITGLAFGGLWIKRRIDRIADPVLFAGWVQIAMGILAILTLPLYVRTFDWMAGILGALQHNDSGYDLFTLLSHGIALAVMVPTTFLAGMTLPLFTYVLLRRQEGERSIGRVYAANTLGAIAGVLFAMHIGMPLLGLKWLIGVGAALDVALGLLLLHKSSERRNQWTLLRGALVGGGALAVVLAGVHLDPKRLSSGVYRYQWAELDRDTKMVHYQDGKTASISLFAKGSLLTISTNGKPDASLEMNPQDAATVDEITMVMAAALPLAYSPDARRVANIGLGSGLTTHTLLADETLESVDTVEIEPAMALTAQGFGERVERTFMDPRSKIHLEDAKTFFSMRSTDYDAIVAEPSNPWVSGVASLFSKEFYKTVGTYLADDGVFVQWLQLYEFNDDLILSVIKALSQNFDDYAMYNTDGTNVLIIAKPHGELPSPQFDRLFAGRLGQDLARVGLRRADDFLARKTGNKRTMGSLLAHSQVPANSDYFPFLDLNAGRARFRGDTANLFRAWAMSPLPTLEMLEVADVEFKGVSGDGYFERSVLIGNARKRYEDLLAADASDRLPTNSYLTALWSLRAACDRPDLSATLETEIHGLANATLAFLDGPEASRLIDVAIPQHCLESAPPALRAWADLYRAVAARDAAAMASSGEAILHAGQTADLGRLRYALAAAMLGRVVENQSDRAVATWQEYQAIAGPVESRPELRLLLSMAVNDTAITHAH